MQKQTIAEIKAALEKESIDELLLQHLRNDQRKGVQRLLKLFDKREREAQELQRIYEQKRKFEDRFLLEGERYLAGVDEAGRGPLAGPVVAASVILPEDFHLYGLTDSKQISALKREEYYKIITTNALSFHVAVMDQKTIDKLNILEATKLAMIEALHSLDPVPHIGLIDAVKLTNTSMRTEAVIKGDAKSIAIAAASILAKVTRDRMMEGIHQEYPMYGFLNHKGYGTKEHLEAIRKYGPCIYHRKSFSPVQEAMNQ